MLVQIYCLKCRVKQDIEAAAVVFKNGKPGAEGICSACGTKCIRFGALPTPA